MVFRFGFSAVSSLRGQSYRYHFSDSLPNISACRSEKLRAELNIKKLFISFNQNMIQKNQIQMNSYFYLYICLCLDNEHR